MSLLTGMLRWNLLEGVATNEVWLAIRDDGATGSGLETDPLNCNLPAFPNTYNTGAPGFDEVMGRLAAAYSGLPLSIRLMPGNYYTWGSQKWGCFSGWRISGAGRMCTKVIGSTAIGNGSGYAFSNASTFLSGFELESLAVEMPTPPSSYGQYGGVRVTGEHIRIKDVWINKFGSNSATPDSAVYGICAFAASANPSFDCVIQDCAVASPDATPSLPYADVVWGTTVPAIGLGLRSLGAGYLHTACAIRDSFVISGSSVFNLVGLTAAGGLCSYADRNRVIYAAVGGPTVVAGSSEVVTGELQGSRNYCAYAPTFLSPTAPSSSTLTLLRLEDNLIDLEPPSGTIVAVSFASGSNINIGFADLSNNRSRRLVSTTLSGDKGFVVYNAANFSVQDNEAEVLATSGRYINGVEYDNVTTATFFSNQTLASSPARYDLLRGYDPTPSPGLLAEELTTKAEDMLLGI